MALFVLSLVFLYQRNGGILYDKCVKKFRFLGLSSERGSDLIDLIWKGASVESSIGPILYVDLMVPGGDTQRRSCHIRNFSKKNSSRGISFLLRQNISRKVQKKCPTNFHCCPLLALALLGVVFLDQWV